MDDAPTPTAAGLETALKWFEMQDKKVTQIMQL